MKFKNLIAFSLVVLLLLASTIAIGQTTPSIEQKKIASQLIECFNSVKLLSSIVLSGECTEVINNRISEQAMALQTKISSSRNALTQKLGAENFSELENQVKNYLVFTDKMNSTITKEERASLTMWISLSRSKVEELFIKLNK